MTAISLSVPDSIPQVELLACGSSRHELPRDRAKDHMCLCSKHSNTFSTIEMILPMQRQGIALGSTLRPHRVVIVGAFLLLLIQARARTYRRSGRKKRRKQPTGAATARDNRCCVARGSNLCGRHLQSPAVHVQAVGDFPSEPIWLDAGTVSTAPSRNNSAGVISTASTDGGHQHPQSTDAGNKRNTKASAAAAKAAGCVLREARAGGISRRGHRRAYHN